MGAICGQIGLEPRAFDEGILERMISRLGHRGGEVTRIRWRDAWFAALSDGPPAVWPAPSQNALTVPGGVVDGRVDNERDLVAELAREGRQGGANAGHLLSTGLSAHGPAFLARLKGFYAAAVHDPTADTTWLIRDPIGMRPLYLHRTRSRILFASEIRALLADPSVRLELDPPQLRVLLSLGFNPAPHSLLKGIHKMPPGHFLQVTRGDVKVHRADALDSGELDLSFDAAVDAYRGILQGVVRRCAAEKTGILLSGGVDSSALALLRTREGKEVTTYTAGLAREGAEEDERTAAWQAARALGTVHRERMIDPSEIPALFAATARICEEPVAAAWGPLFLRLAEAATGQVKLLWSGQGAGALHGEDPVWRWVLMGEWVSGLPPLLGRVVGGVGRRIGSLKSDGTGSRILSFTEERDRIYGGFFLFDDPTLDLLLRAGHMGDRDLVPKLLDRWRDGVAGRDPVAQALHIRARTHLPEAVLMPAERLAAQNRLLLRFPYADPEVVSWLERLPASYRLEGGKGKRLHREALSAWLPAAVFSRPKRDLGDPVRSWLLGEGRQKASEWLLGPAAWIPSVLDGVRVRGLIENAGRGRANIDQLVMLLQLEHWARDTFLGSGR